MNDTPIPEQRVFNMPTSHRAAPKSGLRAIAENARSLFPDRSDIVQEHWMRSKNCRCKDCTSYFEEFGELRGDA